VTSAIMSELTWEHGTENFQKFFFRRLQLQPIGLQWRGRGSSGHCCAI